MDSSVGFSILFVVISGVIGLLPIVAIGVLIYMLLKKNQTNIVGSQGATNVQHNLTNPFSIRNLIRFYLYVIVTISAFILIIGLGITGKVLIGLADQNFSYGYDLASQDYNYMESNLTKPTTNIGIIPSKCYGEDQELVKVNGKDYCFRASEIKLDLVNGIAISLAMLIIFAVHALILVKLERENPNFVLRKMFNFINLIFYSGSSLVFIPVSIYQILNYLVIVQKPVSAYQTPGGIVGYTVFSFFAWMIWLILVLKTKEKNS